ncbi:hypothetical protein M434DRAFT_384540 [Hypoxylon sp. CO27-5]|nr:hypothetical protein M434DRAFT_384540 [Hypoxylon sp. CO27-5]
MTRVCMIFHGHFPLESDEDSDLDDEQALKALLVTETPGVQRLDSGGCRLCTSQKFLDAVLAWALHRAVCLWRMEPGAGSPTNMEEAKCGLIVGVPASVASTRSGSAWVTARACHRRSEHRRSGHVEMMPVTAESTLTTDDFQFFKKLSRWSRTKRAILPSSRHRKDTRKASQESSTRRYGGTQTTRITVGSRDTTNQRRKTLVVLDGRLSVGPHRGCCDSRSTLGLCKDESSFPAMLYACPCGVYYILGRIALFGDILRLSHPLLSPGSGAPGMDANVQQLPCQPPLLQQIVPFDKIPAIIASMESGVIVLELSS